MEQDAHPGALDPEQVARLLDRIGDRVDLVVVPAGVEGDLDALEAARDPEPPDDGGEAEPDRLEALGRDVEDGVDGLAVRRHAPNPGITFMEHPVDSAGGRCGDRTSGDVRGGW